MTATEWHNGTVAHRHCVMCHVSDLTPVSRAVKTTLCIKLSQVRKCAL